MEERLIALARLKPFLDEQVEQYNQVGFIEEDPISIPHQFSLQQDKEIMGFFAAILAWGQRKTILNKCQELIQRMDGAPFDFIVHHQPEDLKQLLGFKHRTFNDTDLLYFVSFLQDHYSNHFSLEDAFLPARPVSEFREEFMEYGPVSENSYSSSACFKGELVRPEFSIEESLNRFRSYFMRLDSFPDRTKKHISSPLQKSTCKRLNMFLRWMVRIDHKGVDFGIWRRIPMAALICPCDVHVERVARELNLLERKQRDWRMALELTENLRLLNPEDPVVYDFALFGMGVEGRLYESLKKRNFAP